MKHVDPKALVSEVPVRRTFANRKEKLQHLAQLVLEQNFPYVQLWHNVEAFSVPMMKRYRMDDMSCSVLGIAYKSPDFKADGIGETMHEGLNYLELSQNELHEFSCDCGGQISSQKASRILNKLAFGPASSHRNNVFVRAYHRMFG